ncbi:hypothetical protein C2E23DRAFT_843269 [Lenzites betulinus]|nr:hypothetical protein C2E23DRAFT_843269 [Lenzites betulinus]
MDHVRPAITSMGAPGPLFVTFSDVTDLPPAPPIPSFASFEVFLDAFDGIYGSGSAAPADAAYWDGQDPPVGSQATQHIPSTSGAHPWDEGLERPDVSMVAVQERPCTRKHRIPDEEIWSKPPKKSKCAASTRLPYTSPLHTPFSSPPSSTASTAAGPAVPPEPIVVVPHEGLQCRMPSCDASLPITDSAWRGHFLNRHHDEICAAGRACPDPRRCLCLCPFKDCAGRVRGGVVQPMSLDSLGRHVLNVHVGVRHQCPVCGAEKKQRRSACVRHIAVCWAKAVGGH